jgi:hypothetical protein
MPASFGRIMVNAALNAAAISMHARSGAWQGRMPMTGKAEFRQAGAFGRKAVDRRAGIEAPLDADFITLPADTAPARTPMREAIVPNEQRAVPGMALFDDDVVSRDAHKPDDRVAFFGFSTLLVLFAFWVSGGHVLADRLLPAPGAAASGSQIVLERVAWRIAGGAAGPSLLVDGFLRNDGARMSALSPVNVVVRGTDGRITQFKINPGAGALAPGEGLGVNARLDLSTTAAVQGRGGPLDRQAAGIETVTVTLLP